MSKTNFKSKQGKRNRRSLYRRLFKGLESLEHRKLLTATIGDFDGDGFEDVAVGVPHEDVGSIQNAGSVNVIYGTSSGLSSANDEAWHQNVSGVKEAAEAQDRFGSALAAGDFNNDGYTDLAIGVPGEDVNGSQDAGAVAVLYGSPSGLVSSSSGSARNDQLIHQDSPKVSDIPENFDRFGSALSVGDYNGDGIADLAIGIPGEGIDGSSDAGAAQVMYGSTNGLIAGTFLSQADNANESYDFFGASLASGDLDADGIDDLAIGVPGEDVNSIVDAGGVRIHMGTSSGISPSDLGLLTQDSGLPGTAVADAAEAFDYFGTSLAIGDLNNDGFADLAIGVPGEDTASKEVDVGVVNIITSGTSSLGTTLPLFNGGQLWSQNSSGIEGISHENDLFGQALAIADFDGDGDNDLAIGVPGEDIKVSGLVKDAGGIHVIENDGNALSSSGNVFLSQASSGIVGTARETDAFGSWLVAGQLNSGTRADLVVSVPGKDIGSDQRAGGVHVLYGTSSAATFSSSNDQFFSQDSSGINGASEDYDYMGGALPIGLATGGFRIPKLSSNPGASNTLYLDFNGHQDQFLGLGIDTQPFDQDRNPEVLSTTELAIIQDTWDTIAEDFAGFDINVTTVASGNAATEMRLVFGGRWQDNVMTKSFVHENAASGVSPMDAFTNSLHSNTAYVFTQTIFNASPAQIGEIIGNVGSHEAGHAFGVHHKSDWSGNAKQNEYSSGGSDWLPIMGSSFASGRAIWTRDEMQHPTNPKLEIRGDNDVAILTEVLGARADDHTDSLSDALHIGTVESDGDVLITHGNIEDRLDRDVFRFDVGAQGSAKLQVLVHDVAPNLDSVLEIGNADNGQVLATYNQSGALGNLDYLLVSPGSYFARVSGANQFRGDIGQYSLRVDFDEGLFIDVIPIDVTPNTPNKKFADKQVASRNTIGGLSASRSDLTESPKRDSAGSTNYRRAAIARRAPLQRAMEDVNGDRFVSPLDALVIINALNRPSTSSSAAQTDAVIEDLVMDINGDGLVTPLDALLVINRLNNPQSTGTASNDGIPPLEDEDEPQPLEVVDAALSEFWAETDELV